jgi:hypothetical protein
MPVEIADVQPDLRDLDKYILREAAGCRLDDEKAQVFDYSWSSCILMLNALAKKILGIYGVSIGNNPLRPAQLGFSNERDFIGERKQIVARAEGDIAVHGKEGAKERMVAALQNLDHEEGFANKLAAEYDPVAWRKVLELQGILYRRALALERAGLVNTNIDGVAPEAAVMKDKEEGGEGKLPYDGSVEITLKGLQCVSSQKWPRVKRKQRSGTHRFDEDVEVVN